MNQNTFALMVVSYGLGLWVTHQLAVPKWPAGQALDTQVGRFLMVICLVNECPDYDKLLLEILYKIMLCASFWRQQWISYKIVMLKFIRFVSDSQRACHFEWGYP